MQPMYSPSSSAELEYRRERIAHDLRAPRRGRRHLRLPRRDRLEVIAPYGDARA